MLLTAKAERNEAEEARKKLEVKFFRSDKGLAALKGTRLKQELDKANEGLRSLQQKLTEQVGRNCS